MSDLWSILEYDKIASEIEIELHRGTGIVLVEGPPGVGKSWLVKSIGGMWDESGGSTVVAEGDLLQCDTSMYALGFALAGLSSGWRSLGTGLAEVTRAGEKFVGTGGLLTTTVQAIGKLRSTRRQARRLYLGPAEQAILCQIEQLSKKRPLLLIADNIHWWDSSSLEFLARLRSPAMTEAFPFLTHMRVVAAQTTEPYQHVANTHAHAALLQQPSTRSFGLQRLDRSRFEDVLIALGASPDLSPSVSDAIYQLSGGHLALAHQCARRVSEGGAHIFLEVTDRDDFLSTMLGERMRALGALGPRVAGLLQVAAVLGLKFRRRELSCAVGSSEPDIAVLLRYCRDEDLVELTEGFGTFVHEIYRRHFLTLAQADRSVNVYEQLSDCLRKLQPGDYEMRCLNAIRAEQMESAEAFAVQAALARRRDGLDWQALPMAILDAMGGQEHVFQTLERALGHLDHYRYAECLGTLSELPHSLPRNLRAEADYVRAACLFVTRSDRDRAEGLQLLTVWAGYEQEEAELGARIIQLLLYGHAMLVDKSAGLQIEAGLKQFLLSRIAFDPTAKDALYTLDRCAGRFHVPDRAVYATRDAATYFGPQPDQDVVRRPVEYYRSLVNFGANLLANAQYEEARRVYLDLEAFVATYAPSTFPRLDYALMNALQAEFRLGLVDVGEAVRRQQDIVARHAVDGDPFYAENALAVYLVLAGDGRGALAIYERLNGQLIQKDQPEPSQLYLIGANSCATRYVLGDVDATAEWGHLEKILATVPYVTTPYMQRRHELLGEVMRTGVATSATVFDTCLLANQRPEFGPLWQQESRGFWLPAIEWWR